MKGGRSQEKGSHVKNERRLRWNAGPERARQVCGNAAGTPERRNAESPRFARVAQQVAWGVDREKCFRFSHSTFRAQFTPPYPNKDSRNTHHITCTCKWDQAPLFGVRLCFGIVHSLHGLFTILARFTRVDFNDKSSAFFPTVGEKESCSGALWPHELVQFIAQLDKLFWRKYERCGHYQLHFEITNSASFFFLRGSLGTYC